MIDKLTIYIKYDTQMSMLKKNTTFVGNNRFLFSLALIATPVRVQSVVMGFV